MADHYLIGIDLGTYGSKGALVDLEGKVHRRKFVEHGVDSPRPGWYEQDADEVWWGDVRTILRHLTTRVDAQAIAGVGISAQCPDMLPVDDSSRPLRKGILYGIDVRAKQEIDELVEQLGEERILAVTGRPLSSQSVGPKIIWFRKHEPDLFRRTHKIHTATSYVNFRLTGDHVVDYATAAGFGPMFNVQKLGWDEGICEEMELSSDLLPSVTWSTDVAGEVTDRAALETGLAPGTPVIAGAPDAFAEGISVGAVTEGVLCLVYGSTMLFVAPVEDLDAPTFPHMTSGLPRMLGGATSASGALTKWFRDNFGQVEMEVESKLGINAYQLLSSQAEGVRPGCDGLVVLPYFAGERSPIWDPMARGVMAGLTLGHTRAHVYRALLEAAAYSVRHVLEDLREAGARIEIIRAVGGGTQSALWTQITSDVIGKNQEVVTETLGAPYGDAFLAGYGVGLFKNLKEVERWVQVDREVVFDEANNVIYDDYYAVYRTLYRDSIDSIHRLTELSSYDR
jgi:xylulokinase